ncbi:DUF4437 domain-containing protein [Atopomonas sediminilitoris]|uniref:DUF4437 domain-containing protein n=1 Tax=Atopomonas sediminilitoris TaxID=2919919 RepID=UPI001F4D7493|nr:DUF4437 domain-containing protein [Atopomonas sediminilitoris]MCJ8170751.1 DUF4437 domain-containing protein [Atopomonas sediminilitoris]
MRAKFSTQLLMLSFVLTASPLLAWAADGNSQVVTAEEVTWGYLNPLRGDKSPGAANLWGDRTLNGATGMLVRFNKGFASPPHIHNISYRGIVIEGLMHNDDPAAERMWMPTGSYWTQPAGENHITAANGDSNLIYLEIDAGPYLVQPAEQRFDNGERPLNVHEKNLVWLTSSELTPISGEKAEVTQLWGSHEPSALNGTMVKLAPGFEGAIATAASEFRAVVIRGQVTHQSSTPSKGKALTAGSYFASSGDYAHALATEEGALIYIRTNNAYKVSSK